MKEQTLTLIKPEAMQRKLIGSILNKFAEKNSDLEIVGLKLIEVTKSLAEKHYESLKDKSFFQMLIDYICSGSYGIKYLIAIVFEGENCIDAVRKTAGATNPEKADPMSIRGAFGRITTDGVFENIIHASSSQEDAEKEIKLWFLPTELRSNIYPTKKVNVSKDDIVWG